jgi:hypothetical protein
MRGGTVKEPVMRGMAMAAALAAAFQLAAPAIGETVVTGQRLRTFALAGPTVLNSGRTILRLRRVGPRAPSRPTIVTLTIDGLTYDSPPGVMYEVYLQGRNGRRALLGLINFYNQTAPGYGGTGATDSRPSSSRSLNATEAFRKLGGDSSIIVFQPISGVTGPAVRANPRARVRFDSATIRAR